MENKKSKALSLIALQVLLFAFSVPIYSCMDKELDKRSEIELKIISDRDNLKAGETLHFKELLTNVSQREIYANFRTFERSAEKIGFYHADEHVAKFFLYDDPVPCGSGEFEGGLFPFSMNTGHNAKIINPGQHEIVDYGFKILKPGLYSFRATWVSSYSADHQDEFWCGSATSERVVIMVYPADVTDNVGDGVPGKSK